MQPFSQIPYVRPDFDAAETALRRAADQVRAAGSYADLRAVYMDQEELLRQISTQESIASIRNTVDTTDPYYEEEMRVLNSRMPALDLLSRQVDAAVLASPYLPDFQAEFGDTLVKDMQFGQRFADERLIPDLVREAELCQEYSKLSATCQTQFDGRTCNFYGLLKYMQSTDRAVRKGAFEAWADLYAQAAPELDRIYDDLVALRVSMAEKLGFSSYIEMAYLKRRRYDYKPEDVATFRKQVREVIVPVVAELFERQRQRLGVDKLRYYDEALVYPEGNPVPQGDQQTLVGKAQRMYRELSPQTGEFFDFMVEGELFDLQTKPGKRPGGYCTSLPAYKAPFIFSNFNGTSADVDVLTHEAGHAFAGFMASRRIPLMAMSHSTSEINEIHSMSMETFTYPWMELFFGDQADAYRYAHLADSLSVVPYMVCVDEYQHRVFENPGMDAMARRQVWRELEQVYLPWRDYDGNAFLEQGGFWMQKQHIFLFPFYYVDYALAQMGAFEFYTRMRQDRQQAWVDYDRLCCAGGSKGYFELLELAGLSNPFHEGSVARAVCGVVEELLG